MPAWPRFLDSPRWRAIAFAAVMVAGALYGALGPKQVFARAACWGGMLLVSFIGWGAAVEHLVLRERRAGWALRAVWGMSLLVALGGVLCLTHMARRPVAIVLVLAGVVLACIDAARAPVAPRPQVPGVRDPSLGWLIGVGAVVLLLLVRYFGSVAETSLHSFDDLLAYYVHSKAMLDTGTLIDPFSVRRMSSYGGQAYLVSLILASDNGTHLKLLDGGLAVLILAGLVGRAWTGARTRVRVSVVLALLFLVSMPGGRFNLGPLLTGAPMFFALVVVLGREDVAPWRRAVLVALPAAAVATMRQSYLVPVALMIVVALASALPRSGGDRREWWRHVAWTAFLCTALLLPWAVLAWISNGTPLFPLLRGNMSSAYTPLSATGGGGVTWTFVRENLRHPEPIRALPLALIVVAAGLLPERAAARPIRALLIAALAGFAALMIGFPLSDPVSIGRYSASFLVPLALVTMLAAGAAFERAPASGARRVRAAALLAGLGLVLQCGIEAGAVRKSYAAQVKDIARAAKVRRRPSETIPRRAAVELQAAVPAGEPLFAMLDDPRSLDFRRNRIALVDLPGAASPRPGMPLARGPSELASYLIGQGFRYAAFVRPFAPGRGELYRRRTWVKQLNSKHKIWQLSAPFYLGFFDDVEGLMRERRVVQDDGTNVLLDLTLPPDPVLPGEELPKGL